MRIEVAAPPNAPTKEKGDLLEDIASQVLSNQQYEVSQQIRLTGSELDLLCKHKVSRKEVYVECKAHRDPLGSSTLKGILGEVTFRKLDEGWLVTTGPLGKDAKGFQKEWEARPPTESQKLVIYTPERILSILKATRLVCDPPTSEAGRLLGTEDRVGDPTLLITPYGRFWSVVCLESGVPAGALVFSASNAALVQDLELLRRLNGTDTTLSSLDFQYLIRLSPKREVAGAIVEADSPDVVVQVATGDSWADYRPARPEDFVGRRDIQRSILRFLQSVRAGTTSTRVLAITGDSGMGKSSLIAKLRDRCRGKRYRKQLFLYAVDVRAAASPTYMLRALLGCFEQALKAGFGHNVVAPLSVSSPSAPLDSSSIRSYLSSLRETNQVVCLVFDQFEELYSRPDLFSVFGAMQRLVLSASSASENFVLGFAWKSDSTVQQDHPAYHIWHRLADHRLEVSLRPFAAAEASNALTLFQKELGEPLRPELRRQLLENSRGYPWLLKKLCIHVYELVKSGSDQGELVDRALDVGSLFERDLQKLTAPERSCLVMIAKAAPADWYDVLEASGPDVLGSLRDKRLVVRSGDRLNLYWDIFREYVLTKIPPSISLSYLPSCQFGSLVSMSAHLDHEHPKGLDELSQLTGLTQKSTGNVVRDLVMFGVASREAGRIRLESEIESADAAHVAKRVRRVLKRHALTLRLVALKKGALISTDDLSKHLKAILPTAQHRERTWRVYADRMTQWLRVAGYLTGVEGKWRFEDIGTIDLKPIRHARPSGSAFHGEAPPPVVLETYMRIQKEGVLKLDLLRKEGRRNALTALGNLGLIVVEGDSCQNRPMKAATPQEEVSTAAKNQETVKLVLDLVRSDPEIGGREVGRKVAKLSERTWTPTSEARVGNALLQWVSWVREVEQHGAILPRRRRRGKQPRRDETQLKLFDHKPQA